MTDHALYRFFDQAGALLYVGITSNTVTRFRQHAHDKPWWPDVSDIRLEHYATRDDVLTAEKAAIQNERPRYNVIHNTGNPFKVRPASVVATAPKPTGIQALTPEQFAAYMLDRHPRVHGPWPERAQKPVCGICGHQIDGGAASAHRVSGRLTVAHTTCRDEMRAAERLAKRTDDIAARQERKAAILRGDIA